MDQEYRMTRINKILEQLNYDHNESKKQKQKHKSKGSALDKADYTLSAIIMITGMSSLSAIASPIVAASLGFFGVMCGIASVVIKTIHKKNSIKIQKWYDMCTLIDDTHSKITLLVSDTLNDILITDLEMRDIIGIYDTYREKLTLLRNEYLTLEKSIKLKK